MHSHWSLVLGISLELGRLELRAARLAPLQRSNPSTLQLFQSSVSSHHLIMEPRVCNSPGGIFATFLKIFF